jgi:pimeloyl-ACP methyl ester carboxylesterase
MGGMIAQELALRHPDRVAALVLACTYAKPDGDTRATGDGLREGLKGVEPKQIFKTMMSVVLTPEFIAREREWLRGLRDKAMESFVLDAFLSQVAATMGHDTTAELENLAAPTLIITGSEDKLIPARNSDELARLIPEAKLVKIPGGSHGFNVEMPDRFNDEVLRFLDRHPLDESRF